MLFGLFVCRRRSHLSSFKQCSGDFIFFCDRFVYSVMQMSLSEFALLPYQYKEYDPSDFPKTT